MAVPQTQSIKNEHTFNQKKKNMREKFWPNVSLRLAFAYHPLLTWSNVFITAVTISVATNTTTRFMLKLLALIWICILTALEKSSSLTNCINKIFSYFHQTYSLTLSFKEEQQPEMNSLDLLFLFFFLLMFMFVWLQHVVTITIFTHVVVHVSFSITFCHLSIYFGAM